MANDTFKLSRGWGWFPFDCKNWITSKHVIKMSASEEGVYIRMLAFQWNFDHQLPSHPKELATLIGRDWRTVNAFLIKWGSELFPEVPQDEADGDNPPQIAAYRSEQPQLAQNCANVRNPKLFYLYETQRDNDQNDGFENVQRREREKGDKTKANNPPSLSPRVEKDSNSSSSTTPQDKTKATPFGTGWNPLTYKEETESTKKDDDLTYESEDVRRILLYHFRHKKKSGDWWSKKVYDAETFAKHITTMYNQMVEDVGESWNPDTSKTTGVKKKASAAAPATPEDKTKTHCQTCGHHLFECKC